MTDKQMAALKKGDTVLYGDFKTQAEVISIHASSIIVRLKGRTSNRRAFADEVEKA